MAASDFNNRKPLEVTATSGNPTLSLVQAVKIGGTDETKSGTGWIAIDWSNVADKSDVALYDENDNLLDYTWETFDPANNKAIAWVYGSFTRDDTVQVQVAYGNGPADNSKTAGTVFGNDSNLFLQYYAGAGATDLAGSNDGTVNGTTQDTGVVDGSWLLDGSADDDIVIPNLGIFDGSQDFTIMMWAKPATLSGDGPIILWSSAGERWVKLQTGETQNIDVPHVRGNLGGSWEDWLVGSAINTGAFYHFCIAYDPVNGMEMYVDAVQEDTNSATGTWDTASQESGIGTQGGGAENFDGEVDDFRIYQFGGLPSQDFVQAVKDGTYDYANVQEFWSQQSVENITVVPNAIAGNAALNDPAPVNVPDLGTQALNATLNSPTKVLAQAPDTQTGAIKLKPVTVDLDTVVAKIAGVAKNEELKWETVNIKDKLHSEVDQCNFHTMDWKPSLNDIIHFEHDGRVTFEGFIDRIKKARRGHKLPEYRVQAKDYTAYLNRIRPIRSYTNETIENIIADLAPDDFTTNRVNCDIELEKFLVDRQRVSDVIDDLAKIVNYNWYVDYDKDIHFFSMGDEQGPDITETNGNLINNSLQVTEDLSQIKNVVTVEGATYESDNPRTETFTADGNKKTYGHDNRFAKKPTLKKNGTEVSFGIENVDDADVYSIMWNQDEKYFNFDSAPSSGDTYTVDGKILVPIVFQQSDSQSINKYGRNEFKIVDKNITSREAARKRATTELKTYAQQLEEIQLKTRNPNFFSGQKVSVDVKGVEGEYIVQQVDRKMDGPQSFKHKISLASAEKLDVIAFLQKLIRQQDKHTEKKESKVLQKYQQVSEEAEVDETISLGDKRYVDEQAQIEETIRKDPFDVVWVYAPSHPDSDADPHREARYGAGATYE